MIKFQHKRKLDFLFALWVMIASVFAPYQALAGMSTDKYYEKCKALTVYTAEADANRWWEKPFTVVSEAAIKMGDETFSKVAPSTTKLVAVGLGLWLAIFTMKIVGSMTESDPLENLTKIGGMMFKGTIACGLLMNKDFFFSYFVVPILDAGAGMAGIGGGGGSGLGATIEPLHKIVDDAHKAIAQTQALGDLAKCISHIYKFKIWGIELASGILDPSVWANGCAVSWITWILMVVWPILIFDALFRIGITAALCPLFIASWVFPVTASFAMKGFNSFLNVAFFYVCLNFAIKMGMKLLEGASGLEYLIPDTPEAKTKTICLLKIGGGDGLSHCAAYASMTSNSTGLIILAACGFYCFLFLKQATVFANYFSDTTFSNDTAFQAAKATGNTAQKGAVMAGKAGAWAADKYSEGRDRKAARTVEAGRKAGGVFVDKNGNPDAKAQKKYMKAEERLRDRGFLDRKTGAETEDYGKLLKNGKRRKFANVASRIATLGQTKGLYQNNNYKTWSGPRDDKDATVSNIQTQYQDYIDKKYP